MNEHEAQRIAAAMHELRPDWPTSSLLTLIRKHLIDKPRRDVTVAFAWIACESNTHTPARVLEAGPWWRAAGIEGTTSNKPTPWEPDTICTTCSKTEDKCRAVRFADDDHPFISRARNAQETDRPAETTRRLVVGLKEATLDEPPERETPPTTTEGTEHVAPIRAALTTTLSTSAGENERAARAAQKEATA